MLILALDTTARAGSVALVRDGVVLHEHSGDAERTHGQRLPGDLIDICRVAGVDIAEVELFAVAAGPGSFTGLRIGIATIQGLAMAREARIVPVSTLEAIAVASARGGRRVAAWMDAQRGEVFAQVFDAGGPDPSAQALTEPISAPPEAALDRDAGWLGGAVFAGDGAVRYREQIVARFGAETQVAERVSPLAGAIGRVAFAAPHRAVLPHAVVPIYVRKPDAEIARDRRTADA